MQKAGCREIFFLTAACFLYFIKLKEYIPHIIKQNNHHQSHQ